MTPDSSIACFAAPSANFVCRPRFSHFAASSPTFATDQSFTSAAIRVGKLLASKSVVGPTPDVASLRFAHSSGTVVPSGVTQPTPVTTTRRRMIRVQRSEVRGQGRKAVVFRSQPGAIGAGADFEYTDQFQPVEQVVWIEQSPAVRTVDGVGGQAREEYLRFRLRSLADVGR